MIVRLIALWMAVFTAICLTLGLLAAVVAVTFYYGLWWVALLLGAAALIATFVAAIEYLTNRPERAEVAGDVDVDTGTV